MRKLARARCSPLSRVFAGSQFSCFSAVFPVLCCFRGFRGFHGFHGFRVFCRLRGCCGFRGFRVFGFNIRLAHVPKTRKKHFASSNLHPPHPRAYDRYNKFLRILETSTPNSHPLLDIQQNQTGELLWQDTGRIHWRILASRSGSILAGYSAGPPARDTIILGGIVGGIHWRLL